MTNLISIEELQKIEQLLDSADSVNVELGILILSGFALDETGANWLYQYYQQLFTIENSSYQADLQRITIGTVDSKPSKASYVLTLLLEKAPIKIQHQIIADHIQNDDLTLPRIELTTFPNVIYQFTNLQSISAKYGVLTIIEAEINSFQALHTLDIAHQPIEFIHPNLAKLPLLKNLIVRNAAFLPDELVDLPDLDIMIEGAY